MNEIYKNIQRIPSCKMALLIYPKARPLREARTTPAG